MGLMIGGTIVGTVLTPEPPRTHYYDGGNGAADAEHKQASQQRSLWIPQDSTGFFALWTAAFTAVLALSTSLLWSETAAAAQISKRALTELEAPFIALEITNPGITRSYGKVGHDFVNLWFCVVNYGRTPAQIIEIVDKLALIEGIGGCPPKVHPQSATRNTMPYGVIAPPSGKSQEFNQNLFSFMMNDLAADPLPLKTKNLFFYGFVRYSTIFNEVFRMGFCYMFDRYSEKWLLLGNEHYNYCRKERQPPPAANNPIGDTANSTPEHIRRLAMFPKLSDRAADGMDDEAGG